ncbi:hypothetical protein NKDENANG_01773 [Candidatus Entotheonellaceae bacterium PAL068K]
MGINFDNKQCVLLLRLRGVEVLLGNGRPLRPMRNARRGWPNAEGRADRFSARAASG